MDDPPETMQEWMSLVTRRLVRLERRPGTAVELHNSGAFLVRDTSVPQGWEAVDELVAPSGWVYVARAGGGA